ncbi:ABC transporter permease subunit [Labrys sedimenti]|uniref:ABC transporter permease subunit n=1 Tax=Labrys sedimenti TaxID=3106036 RepID=UPI002ACA8345|nr:ABC transporter permease [Labrys sp. ZIDIC5]MDZ5452055.1 ABC transporter permease [Labrys sp. ZIDIC5]
MNDAKGAAPLMADARLRRVSPFRRALIRPELGAICGTIAVFLFFLTLAPASGIFSLEGTMNWGTVSAQFMIIAVGACLLMIAGEFDLSVGSMIVFSGIVIALLSTSFGFPMWLAILAAFAVSLAIGALNGFLILRTGLPSFIITLAALFILRGLTTYIPILTNGSTIIDGLKAASAGNWLAPVFGGKILQGLFVWLAEHGAIGTFKAGPKAGQPIVDGIPMLMVWALGLAIVAHVVLTRTVFGSWIFAAGGDANAARSVRQTANVLATIDRVRSKGVGVVFITHNVRHALAIGDRFTVLNHGKTLGTALRGEVSHDELQNLMAGGQELVELESSLRGRV